MKISAVIIAFNEQEKIAAAVESLLWADEILIVDSESTDNTKLIAEAMGAKVINQKWLGFSKQKQFAADRAAHDWVFSLDADEKVSEELKNEILRLKNLSETDLADGYRIPRLTFYMNRAIRHGGWYPDRQLRFFNRKKGKWIDVLIHESFQMIENARIENLGSDILHYTYDNAAQHNRMIAERYAPLAAQQMFERGRRTSYLKIYTAGITSFLQTYILKLGILDGMPGFCIARFAAHHSFLKHLLLWEMQKESDSEN